MKTIPNVKQQIIDHLDALSLSDQEKVLAFVHTLEHTAGLSGKELVAFFSQFAISQDEATKMTRILEDSLSAPSYTDRARRAARRP